MEFTELLDRYLYLRELVQVSHGAAWEDFQQVREELNSLVKGGEKDGPENYSS